MKSIFVISVSVSEYNSSNRAWYTTLKEAESHIMEYADWYCENGSCTITEYDEKFRTLSVRFYRDGKLNSIY